MNAVPDIDPVPVQDLGQPDPPVYAIEPEPRLADLSPEASSRIVRYIVTSTLEHGMAPNAVVALYADLGGDEMAVRYADRRFILREMPLDWRDVENRVVDLESSARDRGVDLAAAWRRATSVAMHGQDVLEQLARLAGVPNSSPQRQRSIFDDPEDLDALEAEDAADALHGRMADRRPERGLPPVELIDLYRGFEMAGDERAQQYLDRVYVEREPPADWLDLQSEAGRLVDMAEARGRDAGRLFADLLRTSPAIEPLVAVRLLTESLLRNA